VKCAQIDLAKTSSHSISLFVVRIRRIATTVTGRLWIDDEEAPPDSMPTEECPEHRFLVGRWPDAAPMSGSEATRKAREKSLPSGLSSRFAFQDGLKIENIFILSSIFGCMISIIDPSSRLRTS